MTSSQLRTVMPGDVRTVWQIVTDAAAYPRWRSDVSRVKLLSGTEFWEYTKDGFVTKFTIRETKVCRRWELEMRNNHLTGRWVGLFRPRGAATVIDFTEFVSVQKLWMKPVVKWYLKKQQARFAADLRGALARR